MQAFVGGLARAVNVRLLREVFEGFPVENVEIVQGRSRFACVKFKTAEACSSALNTMHGVVLAGRTLHVRQWNEQRSARSTRRRRQHALNATEPRRERGRAERAQQQAPARQRQRMRRERPGREQARSRSRSPLPQLWHQRPPQRHSLSPCDQQQEPAQQQQQQQEQAQEQEPRARTAGPAEQLLQRRSSITACPVANGEELGVARHDSYNIWAAEFSWLLPSSQLAGSNRKLSLVRQTSQRHAQLGSSALQPQPLPRCHSPPPPQPGPVLPPPGCQRPAEAPRLVTHGLGSAFSRPRVQQTGQQQAGRQEQPHTEGNVQKRQGPDRAEPIVPLGRRQQPAQQPQPSRQQLSAAHDVPSEPMDPGTAARLPARGGNSHPAARQGAATSEELPRAPPSTPCFVSYSLVAEGDSQGDVPAGVALFDGPHDSSGRAPSGAPLFNNSNGREGSHRSSSSGDEIQPRCSSSSSEGRSRSMPSSVAGRGGSPAKSGSGEGPSCYAFGRTFRRSHSPVSRRSRSEGRDCSPSRSRSPVFDRSRGLGRSRSPSRSRSPVFNRSRGLGRSRSHSRPRSPMGSRSRSLGRGHSPSRSRSPVNSRSRGVGRGRSHSRSRHPVNSRSRSLGRGRSLSRSHSPVNSRSRSLGRSRSHSQSRSPMGSRSRSLGRGRSPSRSGSPVNSRSRSLGRGRSRSRSRSPVFCRSRGFGQSGSASRSRSPVNSRSRGLSRSRNPSRSRSPVFNRSRGLRRSQSPRRSRSPAFNRSRGSGRSRSPRRSGNPVSRSISTSNNLNSRAGSLINSLGGRPSRAVRGASMVTGPGPTTTNTAATRLAAGVDSRDDEAASGALAAQPPPRLRRRHFVRPAAAPAVGHAERAPPELNPIVAPLPRLPPHPVAPHTASRWPEEKKALLFALVEDPELRQQVLGSQELDWALLAEHFRVTRSSVQSTYWQMMQHGDPGGDKPLSPAERDLIDELMVRALLRIPSQQGQSKEVAAVVDQEADLRARLTPQLLLKSPSYKHKSRFERFLWSRLGSTHKAAPVKAVAKSGRYNIYGLVASSPLVAELQAQEEQRRRNLGQQQQQQQQQPADSQ